MEMDRFLKTLAEFRNDYNGNKLFEKHSLDEQGIWQIMGADTNCDMGGSHHMPDLGLHTGTLREVLELAFSIPAFRSWGFGEIKRMPYDNIPSAKERLELMEKLNSLKCPVCGNTLDYKEGAFRCKTIHLP